jgi:hypothetical protein
MSLPLLLLLPGRFLALRGVVGAAVGLLLQQRLISSPPSRDSSCTRTHNPSAAQALYTARMRATGLKGGLPGVGAAIQEAAPPAKRLKPSVVHPEQVHGTQLCQKGETGALHWNGQRKLVEWRSLMTIV